MAFYEVRFPLAVEAGVTGGPMRRTDVVQLASGRSERNQRWANSLRRWDASSGVKRLQDLVELVDFFEMAAGRAHGFRLRDWSDWKSCAPNATPAATDQLLGIGNGVATQFQLVKLYGKPGFRTWSRNIHKPVAGTVKVAVNGVVQASGWSVNTVTGVVTFTAPPASSAEVRAGFEFDCPVHFGTDGPLPIEAQLFDAATGYALGRIGEIPLEEVVP